jgi:hypothetical protein
VFVLFFFGRYSDFLFDSGVGHEDEGPRLLVGARWGLRRGLDAVEQRFTWYGFVRVVPHCPARSYLLEKLTGSINHFAFGSLDEIERPRLILRRVVCHIGILQIGL